MEWISFGRVRKLNTFGRPAFCVRHERSFESTLILWAKHLHLRRKFALYPKRQLCDAGPHSIWPIWYRVKSSHAVAYWIINMSNMKFNSSN